MTALMVQEPLYLANPLGREGLTYGTLAFKGGNYVIGGDPVVLEAAKRIFPGSAKYLTSQFLSFAPTKRSVGDLNWLMLRYPLDVLCGERFEEDRQKAIDHALRRESLATLPEVSLSPPGFVGELRPYQAEAVSFLLAHERTLLADDMGLGKTVAALAALAQARAFPALLVVPTNIQRQWQRMAGNFLQMPDGGPPVCHQLKGLKASELPEADLYVLHYGLLQAWRDAIRERGLSAVVFDEIQELRHTGTQKYSSASLVAGDARLVWGLSGTPIYNYGDEIWSVLNILEYHCLGDRDSFTREWCTGYGERVVGNPARLGAFLRQEGLLLRRRKSEVLEQLPPKRRVVMTIEHDEARYSALIKDAVQLAKGLEKIEAWNERGLARRQIESDTRRATGAAKAPYVAEFVNSLLEAGERVLVYSWHHEVHDTLAEKLAFWQPVRVTGTQTASQKDEAVKRFASGLAKVILISLRTAAGLDGLQESGTCVVFAELDWSPAVHSQCEDRLHRIGLGNGVESVLCYYLVSETGMDEAMQDVLGLKVGQFTELMADRSESEEDKVLAQRAAEDHLSRVIERLKERRG